MLQGIASQTGTGNERVLSVNTFTTNIHFPVGQAFAAVAELRCFVASVCKNCKRSWGDASSGLNSGNSRDACEAFDAMLDVIAAYLVYERSEAVSWLISRVISSK